MGIKMQLSPLILLVLQAALNFNNAAAEDPSIGIEITSLLIERSRAFSLLFSALNCLSATDDATAELREINQNFNPEAHLAEYENRTQVELLLQLVEANQVLLPDLATEPFTFTSASINEMLTIMAALLPNAGNWPLFYNTSAWLIDRVNSNRLYFALSVVAGEKFTHTAVTPTSIEVYPQMFINKMDIAKLVGMTLSDSRMEEDPLYYFFADPWINEFHWNWRIDNPFFWDETIFPKRKRQGELFFFMHHQLVARYNAERASNDLPYVTLLDLEPDYVIPEAYYPDIINVNYVEYPVREAGTKMEFYDDETKTALSDMKSWFEAMEKGINDGFLVASNGSQVSLRFDNASNILGYAAGAAIPSPNEGLYGDLHDHLHKFLAGMDIPDGKGEIPSPGVQASSSTAVRDPVFFQLHKTIDKLYADLKAKDYKPYTEQDLNYPNFQIHSVVIRKDSNEDYLGSPHTLTTYFKNVTFDISTAARPCRGVGGSPASATVKTLQHDHFDYLIKVQSNKSTKAYGMVRIFLLPLYAAGGRLLEADESHQNAILLDVFRVEFKPKEYQTIVRSSKDSSVTRTPLPGIKELHEVNSSSSGDLLQVGNTRACGFPNNLLIPKGTEKGMEYKLFVMISEEPQPPSPPVPIIGVWNNFELPHYPYCGMLQGLRYPDGRSMGYPFDRPGTRFDNKLEGISYENVRIIPIKIKHR